MIPIAIPSLSDQERDNLVQCIETGFVSSVGPFVGRFEKELELASGARHVAAVSTGTAGLQVALLAAGVARGDLVIIPALTFIATANAVSHAGADPWILDISPNDWGLCSNALATTLERDTILSDGRCIHLASGRRVAAVMPVFVFGLPCAVDEIQTTAARFGLPVVVDAAAALGATFHGRKCAGLGATFTVFSFNGNKTVTCGGGGAVAGDDEPRMRRVRHLSTTARVGANYDHDEVGFNFRMTNLQAAVGVAQLGRLPEFLQRKRDIDQRYRNAFAGMRGVGFFPRVPAREGACWLSGITLENANTAERLRMHLTSHGIECRQFWKPIHLQTPYREALRSACAVAEEIWSRIVVLPSSVGITEEQLQVVTKEVRLFANAK